MGGPYQQQLQEVRLNVSPGPDKALSLCEDYELLLFGPSEQSRLLVAISITDQAGTEINLMLRHQHFLIIRPLLLSPGAYTQYFFLLSIPDLRPCFPFGSRVRASTSGWVLPPGSCHANVSLAAISFAYLSSNYRQVIKSWPLNCQHSYLKSNNKCGTHVRR